MLKVKFVFSALLVISQISFAQRVEPFTINSGGGSAQAQNTILTFAIGESVVGNTAGIIPSIFLFETVTDIRDTEKSDRFMFYPNPVRNDLFVNSDEDGLTFYIYSLQGVLLSSEQNNSISVEHLGAAPYLVILKNRRGAIIASEIIVKL
jgi:hypothetical protein